MANWLLLSIAMHAFPVAANRMIAGIRRWLVVMLFMLFILVVCVSVIVFVLVLLPAPLRDNENLLNAATLLCVVSAATGGIVMARGLATLQDRRARCANHGSDCIYPDCGCVNPKVAIVPQAYVRQRKEPSFGRRPT